MAEQERVTFKVCVRVTGTLHSSFVFKSIKDANVWIRLDFEELKKQHGNVSFTREILTPLYIGDKCNVYGDGADVYTILGIKEYSPNRFGFILNSGFSEEVAKCHNEFIK